MSGEEDESNLKVGRVFVVGLVGGRLQLLENPGLQLVRVPLEELVLSRLLELLAPIARRRLERLVPSHSAFTHDASSARSSVASCCCSWGASVVVV